MTTAGIVSSSISTKSGRVTVAGKPSDDLAAGTLGSILKQACLKQ
jgi:predicted RNA binding protein YcfA (HicA-like mRNA interferase family)